MLNRALAFFILIFTLNTAFSAPMCSDLFSDSGRTREPHFPNSVYAKFPESVVPKILDLVSMNTLETVLNQMTLEVSANIPLPQELGATHKKIEVDLDVEQFGINNGSLVSRLSTTLKTSEKSNRIFEMPKDFLDHHEQANTMLALHMDMINAALKSSLSDLSTHPLKIEAEGLTFLIKKAPELIAIKQTENQQHSRVMARAEATVPRDSIMGSGIAFKNDIRAEVSLEAELVIEKDNSVSLKVIRVQKHDFELDADALRFNNSTLMGRTAKWAIEKIAVSQILRFNNKSKTQPMIIRNLFRVPAKLMGLNIQLLNMYLDNDGYMKVQLNIEPENESKLPLKVRIKQRS